MSLKDLDDFDFDSITPETLKADAKERILTRLRSNGLEVDMREGSYTDALISEESNQVYKALMLAPDLLAAAIPNENSGPYLDSFANIYGFTRAAGTRAEVLLRFSGTDGTVIPAGTFVCTDTGERFRTLAAATIDAGTATANAEAEQIGTAYNVDIGALKRLQISIHGVSGVINPAKAEGGTDQETDQAFYQRIHVFLSEPVSGGNPNSYKQWALECSGVGFVDVLPLWNGNGTVKVIIAGADKLPVPKSVREAVAAHIEQNRLIGADVTVVSVVALEISVEATISPENDVSLDDIEADLAASLRELFDTFKVGAGETLRYNQVLARLLSLHGVVDCSALTVNGDTKNIVFDTEQVPQLGAVTIVEG